MGLTGLDLPRIRTKIPGPKSRILARRLLRYECPNITGSSPIFWETAKGANVMDVDRNLYIDLSGGFGVANSGHANPRSIRALVQQAYKLPHTLGDVHPAKIKVELLQTLSEICPNPLKKTLLASSGSEAVEIALKTALLATGKPGVIVFDGAYHGLTYGVLGATSMLDFELPFQTQLSKHTFRLPFPVSYLNPIPEEKVLSKIKSLIRHRSIGAVLIEPIQGRGGIRIAPTTFLKSLRQICNENKVLLIADEVFSGFGRTGKFFAFQHSGIVPDLVTIGKGFSGGFPISGCIGTSKVMDAWPRHHGEALHTSTFLGNPMGCAMALASIQEIRGKRLVERAKNKGEKFLEKFKTLQQRYSSIGNVRGAGLMIGIEIVKGSKKKEADPLKARTLSAFSLKKGIILLADGIRGNVLSITPSLTITEKQLNYFVQIIQECLKSLKN